MKKESKSNFSSTKIIDQNVSGRTILYLTTEFPPGPGGIGNHGFNLVNFLYNSGYKITVLTERRNFKDGKFYFPWPVIFLKRYRWSLITYLIRLYQTLKYNRSHEIIICSGKFYLWIGAFLKLFSNKQVIGIVHGSELDLKSSFLHQLTSQSLLTLNAIISVSKYTDSFLPRLPSDKNQPRFIIPNGIDYKLLNPLNLLDTKQKDKRNSLALLSVGTISERKGQYNLIRALPDILNKFPETHYHIAGIDDQKELLLPLIDELSLSAYITIHGRINTKRLEELYRQSDILIMLSSHTSSGDFEGFGIAILEANAFGKPAIGSRNSGIADAIKQDETGQLVDEKNNSEILNAIKLILNNYEKYSEKSKAWALEHDWEIIGKEYLKVINFTLAYNA